MSSSQRSASVVGCCSAASCLKLCPCVCMCVRPLQHTTWAPLCVWVYIPTYGCVCGCNPISWGQGQDYWFHIWTAALQRSWEADASSLCLHASEGGRGREGGQSETEREIQIRQERRLANLCVARFPACFHTVAGHFAQQPPPIFFFPFSWSTGKFRKSMQTECSLVLWTSRWTPCRQGCGNITSNMLW